MDGDASPVAGPDPTRGVPVGDLEEGKPLLGHASDAAAMERELLREEELR